MYTDDLKRIIEMDPATARGRNRSEGREIDLSPDKGEIERDTKVRTDAYIAIARDLAHEVKNARCDVSEKELERVEFVREELFHLAQDVLVNMVKKG